MFAGLSHTSITILSNSAHTVLLIWIILFLASLYFRFMPRFLVKNRHKIAWQSIGSPSPFIFSIQNNARWREYLWSSTTYKALNDPQLNKIIGISKIVTPLYVVAFIILILLSPFLAIT